MKISFVVSEDENLGVGFLSNYLKKNGHQVDLIFNPRQFNKAYTRNKFLAKIFDWHKINLEELKKQNPDVIGFSCLTASYQWALEFAGKVKKETSKPIIFGGVHPTLMPEIVINNDAVDMVCIGEGEEALLELADNFNKFGRYDFKTDIKNIWFKINGNIIRNEVRPLEENIDKYEMDRELFFKKLPGNYRKYAYFISSRGCPFNCTYCGNEQKRKVYSGKIKYVRQKSVGQTIKELKKLKNGGTKNILFVDDVLTMDRKWFTEFINRYRKEINLPFTCFVHAKLFNEELADLLKKSRCELVWYGIQTGSERVRKNILERYESNEEIIRAAKICREFGLKYMVDHIFDIPADDDIRESITLYNAVRPYMINCYNLLYFPTAKIIDHAINAGLLTMEDVNKINCGQSIVYQTGALSSKSNETRDNYRKYALLLTLIPLLPVRIVEKISLSNKAINFFGKLPLFLIPIIKVFLNFRVNHGFVPLVVIKTELFWIKEFVSIFIKKRFFQKIYR